MLFLFLTAFGDFLRFLWQSRSQTVQTCLSREEKQKMAASCGQVQPPSSTLLISVRRKRSRRRPGSCYIVVEKLKSATLAFLNNLVSSFLPFLEIRSGCT